MKTSFLEFEQPIAELEAKIEELRYVQDDSAVDISEEIERLKQKNQSMTKDIYAKLTAWQISQVARHPQRPYTLDYIQGLFTDFEELHGDRAFAEKVKTGEIAGFFGPRRELHTYYGLQALYDFNHPQIIVDGRDKWIAPPIPAFYDVGAIFVDETNIDEFLSAQPAA